jgi:hypothetical protein
MADTYQWNVCVRTGDPGNKHGNGDEFPDFINPFFFWQKNVRVDWKHTYYFVWPNTQQLYILECMCAYWDPQM